jgi:hypothetical protein
MIGKNGNREIKATVPNRGTEILFVRPLLVHKIFFIWFVYRFVAHKIQKSMTYKTLACSFSGHTYYSHNYMKKYKLQKRNWMNVSGVYSTMRKRFGSMIVFVQLSERYQTNQSIHTQSEAPGSCKGSAKTIGVCHRLDSAIFFDQFKLKTKFNKRIQK